MRIIELRVFRDVMFKNKDKFKGVHIPLRGKWITRLALKMEAEEQGLGLSDFVEDVVVPECCKSPKTRALLREYAKTKLDGPIVRAAKEKDEEATRLHNEKHANAKRRRIKAQRAKGY